MHLHTDFYVQVNIQCQYVNMGMYVDIYILTPPPPKKKQFQSIHSDVPRVFFRDAGG